MAFLQYVETRSGQAFLADLLYDLPAIEPGAVECVDIGAGEKVANFKKI